MIFAIFKKSPPSGFKRSQDIDRATLDALECVVSFIHAGSPRRSKEQTMLDKSLFLLAQLYSQKAESMEDADPSGRVETIESLLSDEFLKQQSRWTDIDYDDVIKHINDSSIRMTRRLSLSSRLNHQNKTR